MAGFIHDLRYGLRVLCKSPGFTIVAVATLTLAIGANTATFSVLDAVVLQSLPYRDSDRLGVIWVDFGERGQSLPAVSSLDFRDFKEMATLFEDFAAGTGTTANLTGSGDFDPEQVNLGRVTYNFFALLGVEPALGRGFLEEEDVLNGPRVAILSDGLWKRRFGADPSIVGRSIQLNDTAYEVVGVMPPSFSLHLPAEAWLTDAAVWIPLQDPYQGPRNRTLITAVTRLRDGASFAQAQEEMDGIALRLREEHLVHAQADTRIRVVPLRQDVIKNVKPALLALFAAVGLVLAVACGTVANLMLARATAREREIAIRLSLGASRARVVRQLLTESALVAFAAGALGLLLALWGTDFLLSLQPTHLPRVENVTIGGETFGFTAAICLLTVILFGVLPAIQASRPKLYGSLREGSPTPSASGFGRESLRAVFVAGEVALALVLLICVALLTRSYVLLKMVRPGFDAEGLVTFRLSLPPNRYPSLDERMRFHDELRERLEALPGVRSAGAISYLPLSGATSQAPYAYDADAEQNWESVTADARTVTTGFFETADTRLIAGRVFDEADTLDKPLVVVVNDVLARKAWPGQSAVGQRLLLPFFGPEGVRREWMEVVGVMEHIHLHDLSGPPREQVFFPARQGSGRSMDVVIRVDGDPAAVLEIARLAVRDIDPELPFHRPRPVTAYVSEALAPQRFTLVLGACFGSVALLLAAIALYGLISYAVSLRARELGIRIALGARAGGIFRLVIGRGLRLVVTGIAIGVPLALIASHALQSMMFGIGASDPLTLVGGSLLLALVAAVACYVPARRATRIDPTGALRCE